MGYVSCARNNEANISIKAETDGDESQRWDRRAHGRLILGPEDLVLQPLSLHLCELCQDPAQPHGSIHAPSFVCFSKASLNRASGICSPKTPDKFKTLSLQEAEWTWPSPVTSIGLAKGSSRRKPAIRATKLFPRQVPPRSGFTVFSDYILWTNKGQSA